LNTNLPPVEREDNRSSNKPIIFHIVALSWHPGWEVNIAFLRCGSGSKWPGLTPGY